MSFSFRQRYKKTSIFNQDQYKKTTGAKEKVYKAEYLCDNRSGFASIKKGCEQMNLARSIYYYQVKKGLIVKDEGTGDKFLDFNPDEPMDQIHSSSITYRIVLGKYKGEKALTLGSIPIKSQKEKDKPFLSKYSGCSLHGGVSCKPHERKKLEHLCRYISKPSLSEERLSVNDKRK